MTGCRGTPSEDSGDVFMPFNAHARADFPRAADSTQGQRGSAARRLKRAVDVGASACALVALSPVLVALALAVRLESPGPVLFRQERSGRDGRIFTMLKFRSMVQDAEARKALLSSDSFDGRIFKQKQDPRVTRVGAVLRRHSLDELPQLVNVLRGEMSLVGPRPYLPHETATFDSQERRRLAVLPGLTGLGQVSGRADLTWAESIRLDLHYIDHWSPVVDVAICLRTVAVVARGSGAY